MMKEDTCKYRVSTKAIIEDSSGKILLIKEPSGLWELPGGGLEYGESTKDALKREVKEEIGADIKTISDKPDYIWSQDRRKEKGFYAFFLGHSVTLETLDIKPETTDEYIDFGFFSKEEMADLKLHPILTNFMKLL